ncbi:MAG TPA: hypothetical protein DCS91_10665 [Microcoleaceae bacterium UBA11344]|nr:hypothetical protein [Microcoleaceae cyanobacterium UBA11344]
MNPDISITLINPIGKWILDPRNLAFAVASIIGHTLSWQTVKFCNKVPRIGACSNMEKVERLAEHETTAVPETIQTFILA